VPIRKLVTAAAVVGACAAGVTVVASAQTQANGLPAYTDGYLTWPKLNRRPVTGGSPAHSGIKNVYASKRRAGKTFPNGTVIVKTIAAPGSRGLPRQVAVMRKLSGKWQWAEYARGNSRYTKLALPTSVCTGCHVGARSSDWVFTKS